MKRAVEFSSLIQYLEDEGIFLQSKTKARPLMLAPPPSKEAYHQPLKIESPQVVMISSQYGHSFPSHFYDNEKPSVYFNQCFIALEKLGEGSFGKVFKAKSRDDDVKYAVKIARHPFRSARHKDSVLKEVRLHEKLAHSNIVRLYNAWEDRKILYMQLELCAMNLDVYARTVHDIDEQFICYLFNDLLQAVKYIHDLPLIHMDIKLDNILISSDGLFKLSDFGIAHCGISVKQNPFSPIGDQRYLAPETVTGGLSTKAVDIFGIGISVLEVASDVTLPSKGLAWEKLREGRVPKEQTKHISKEVISMICVTLHPDPALRPTAEQLLNYPIMVHLQERRGMRMNPLENFRLHEKPITPDDAERKKLVEEYMRVHSPGNCLTKYLDGFTTRPVYANFRKRSLVFDNAEEDVLNFNKKEKAQ